MKHLLTLITFLVALFSLSSCRNKIDSRKESISFYRVPLVCGAAHEIGCGSRIKPLFIDTEKEKHIRESWTNRQGTVIAIVWADAADNNDSLKMLALFTKNDIEAEVISDTADLKQLFASFRDNGKWLKGMDIDKLSIEEAGVIAKEATGFALEEGYVDSSEAAKIKNDIEAYLKNDLVKVRTLEDLSSNATQEMWRNEMYKILLVHIGKERADKVSAAYQKKMSEIKDCE